AKARGMAFSASEVVVTCGAKHALYNLFQALLDPGDEVVLLAPYWVSYADMVRLAEGVPVVLTTHEADGFQPSADQIARAIGPRTRAVVLNSPANPTGAVL